MLRRNGRVGDWAMAWAMLRLADAWLGVCIMHHAKLLMKRDLPVLAAQVGHIRPMDVITSDAALPIVCANPEGLYVGFERGLEDGVSGDLGEIDGRELPDLCYALRQERGCVSVCEVMQGW